MCRGEWPGTKPIGPKGHAMNAQTQAQTSALVRASWNQVEPIAPAAAALFYRHLFADAPELRALSRRRPNAHGPTPTS